MKGLRYQHRSNCELITPYGTVQLDDEGNVTNPEDFNREDLLTIHGFVDAEIFGELPAKPKPKLEAKPPDVPDHGPSDEQYWGLIKELTEKGANLNTEGYVQMESLTAAIRARGWPPISGTRRLRVTNEGRERDKAAQAEKTEKHEASRPQ